MKIANAILATKWFQNRMIRSIHLPAPKGPYAVGTRELTLTSTKYPAVDGKGRKIGLKIWYPAEVSGIAYEPYLMDKEMAQLFSGDGPNYAAYLANLSTHSQSDAPFSTKAGLCPVILFSHGYGTSNRYNTLACESLASFGYAVIAVGHTGEGFCTLIDGEKVPQDPDIKKKYYDEAMRVLKNYPKKKRKTHTREYIQYLFSETHYVTGRIKIWTSDLQQVADWVQAEQESFFQDHLQKEHFAAFGHSFGGGAALRVMLLDKRFVCVVDMDGQPFGGEFLEQIETRPMMVMSCTRPEFQSCFHPQQKGIHWVTIPTAKHMNFTDLSVVFGNLSRLTDETGMIEGGKMIEIMTILLLSFFNKYYLNISDANILDATKQFPEIQYAYEEPEKSRQSTKSEKRSI